MSKKKEGTFDYQIDDMREEERRYNEWSRDKAEPVDSRNHARDMAASYRAAIAVLKACDLYTGDDDGTKWVRLYNTINKARKIAGKV